MPIDIKTAFGPERQTRSVLILSAIVLAIYFPFASMISSRVVSTPRPPGKAMRLLKFQKMPEASLPGGGFAYFVRAYSEFEDSDPKAQKSPVMLYENDRPLGPAHSDHYDIEAIGLGRYSHWKDLGLLFSASDNTDPNKNGRAYWAVIPGGKS